MSFVGISDSLQKDAKGAVKAVIDMISIAATMTQGVPYLGMVSSALTEFLKIQDVRNTQTLLRTQLRLILL